MTKRMRGKGRGAFAFLEALEFLVILDSLEALVVLEILDFLEAQAFLASLYFFAL